jgi:hypothetical protein
MLKGVRELKLLKVLSDSPVDMSTDETSGRNKKAALSKSIEWAYKTPKEKSITVDKRIPSSNYSKQLQSQAMSHTNGTGKQQLLALRSLSDFNLDENDLIALGLGGSARSNLKSTGKRTAKNKSRSEKNKTATDGYGEDDDYFDDDEDEPQEEKKVAISSEKHVMDKMLDSQLIKLARQRHKFIQACNFQKKLFIKRHIINKHAPINLR